MKYFFVTLFTMALALTACNNSGGEKQSETQPAADSTTTAAMYVCPMHPDISSEKPGTCSVCGMDLEKKK